ncbi:MAG: hypothetical protein ACRDOJ_03725 [Nocardioidaceae bacterium]
MDVHEQLAQIRSVVENARAMPMSASAVVNRADLLAQIDALAAELSSAFQDAQRLTSDRAGVVAEGRTEADGIIAEARQERDRMITDSEVYKVAKREADLLREEAEADVKDLRRETDEYVDTKLANFEITLSKTLEAVSRGRERLKGRSELDSLGREDVDEILLPGHDDEL